MIEGINYSLSWVRARLQTRLGQRGAEMVEYAILLAVIAVLGIWFYSNVYHPSEHKARTFARVLGRFWTFIGQQLGSL
ncbi:hypothetical protein [uncultured Phascolarctobacterium sp.]|uniref:hypothetical protein n=1 Tax=uncultured Phascolarctobacterium sp. TaxID=512296 RepID=UPI0025D496B9|nr:hypothetical protein [uncultured Phascolarctobacterium sp.]